MKKCFTLLLLLISCYGVARADEGMWLLPYLEKVNAKDMKAHGLKIPVKEIYNPAGASLNDAVVVFGAGCTGEIVSPDGLVFTNHHCGYGAIQKLSSVERDYLKNGFWAMSRGEEIPAPGLTVKFVRRIEDVTSQILNEPYADEKDRKEKVKKRIEEITKEWAPRNEGKTILVKDIFGGNQFFLFVIEEYRDVRLVGAPPTSIGKFGGDTDNWMWPRHTGDFSIFRVYSDKEGKPAEYSPENVPYSTPTHLKVSLRGYKEGDFDMIMGFPGSTQRYMTSYQIDQTLQVTNPTRIFIRGVRQEILKKDMESSDRIRIQYASKYAQSSNYWKNSIGMNRGLRRLDVKSQKEALENRFTHWAGQSSHHSAYAGALPMVKEAVEGRTAAARASQYLSEAITRATEILSVASLRREFLDQSRENKYMGELDVETKASLKTRAANFYKDYNEATDRKVAQAMFRILRDSLTAEELPSLFADEIDAKFEGDIATYIDYLYDTSVFANQDSFNAFIDNYDSEALLNDPAVVALESTRKKTMELNAKAAPYNLKFSEGMRLFIAGLMEMDKDKKHYPDANFTIRLTYGNILPYKPADAVFYDYYTTLSGVLAKEDAMNPAEFTVPSRLKQLYADRDFGAYAYKGDVTVAFISNNDITGGNSGSPVLNNRGELIGLAFDGNWEAMSGDIAFEPELQRCINVDIRYVLFIVDKFAGAGYLLNEMTIVR